MPGSAASSLPYPRDAVVAVGTGDGLEEALDRALELAPPSAPGAVVLADPQVDPRLVQLIADRLHAAVIEPPTGEPRTIDYGGAVGRHLVDPAWADAPTRVVVAKNRSQRRLLYAGAMTTVLRAVPELDRLDAEVPDIVRAALEALPVSYGVVDAWESRDRRGTRQTGAILASANVLALDWLMGEKMELDPALNPVVREGVLRWGRIRLDRRGNLTPWPKWHNATLAGAALAGLLPSKGASWTAR